MTQPPTYGPHNPHPLSQLRTELVWEGKYDEYGNRREVDIAGCAMPMQQVYDRMNITPQQLREFCQKWQIEELAVFGSILQDDFRMNGEQPSDVDLLFTYGKNSRKNLILQVRMKFELEDLVHRSVDLVSKTAILADPNYIRRRNILESARVIYVEDKESVLDIVEAVKKILGYTAGVTFAEFLTNDEKQDAVLRRILVIGEATKRLSPEFRQSYPDTPWQDIAGIRDIIVHDYNRIDAEIIGHLQKRNCGGIPPPFNARIF